MNSNGKSTRRVIRSSLSASRRAGTGSADQSSRRGLRLRSKNFNSNCGIVLTGRVVLIDSGTTDGLTRDPRGGEKLTPLPVRFLIDTEPHPDHTTAFLFSPRGHHRRGRRGRLDALARARRSGAHPEARGRVTGDARALDGYRFVTPHLEYHQKMALKVGADVRADVFERRAQRVGYRRMAAEGTRAVLAAGIVVDQINNLRPFVSIPDILAAAKMMKSSTVHVIPGHGRPHGEDLRDSEKYYALLLERVAAGEGRQVAGSIKKEVRMPDTELAAQERPDQRRGGLQTVKGAERLLFSDAASGRGIEDVRVPASGERESCRRGAGSPVRA